MTTLSELAEFGECALQVQLPLPCLSAVLHEGLHPALCLRIAQRGIKQGEVLQARLPPRHALCGEHGSLRSPDALRRKRSDARSQRRHMSLHRGVVREDSVQQAVAFRLLRVDLNTAENDLHCPTNTDQLRQLDAAGATRRDAQGNFHLGELRLTSHPKAHVEVHCELVAAATGPAADLRDRGLRHIAQDVAERVPRVRHCLLDLGPRSGQLEDGIDVEVRKPEVLVGTPQHEYSHRLIRGHMFDDICELPEESTGQQIQSNLVLGAHRSDADAVRNGDLHGLILLRKLRGGGHG
mmetsp:Transcript_86746/g.194118  ORF Transcript_86746/g.194118 Transcript_86746/m.194118 type:complete len:295 (-) Transcript_86746:57-941(-)